MAEGIRVRVTTEIEDVPGPVSVLGAGTELAVLPWFEATATGKALPFDVWLRAELQGGAYVVEELRVTRKRGGGPVTAEGMRQIPLAQITRLAVERVILKGTGRTRLDLSRGEGPTPQLIAEVYRFGVLVGQSPTQLVAETFRMSRAAAGRWISRARGEGYLGPAVGTKAGEAGG